MAQSPGGLERPAASGSGQSPLSRRTAWKAVVVAAHRLQSLVLRNAAPRSRSEQEVAGYRDALGLIRESGEQIRRSSEGTVLQLRGMLYRYMPQPGGHWKATSNDIVERHPDGSSRIRFRPVAAHLTSIAMADLMRATAWPWINAADSLVLVPLAILDFLSSTPSRMAAAAWQRLLTLQLLYHF